MTAEEDMARPLSWCWESEMSCAAPSKSLRSFGSFLSSKFVWFFFCFFKLSPSGFPKKKTAAKSELLKAYIRSVKAKVLLSRRLRALSGPLALIWPFKCRVWHEVGTWVQNKHPWSIVALLHQSLFIATRAAPHAKSQRRRGERCPATEPLQELAQLLSPSLCALMNKREGLHWEDGRNGKGLQLLLSS